MNDANPSHRPAGMTAQEWELRVDLAAAYRLVDHFGWTELIFGHLTARVPGPEPHFLINPYGLGYDEVTASNLLKIDTEGNLIDPSNHQPNKAGFVIHSAIHMAPEGERHVVMHTHSRAGMAVAASKAGLLPVSMGSTAFFGRISYHGYEGVSLYLDERDRILADLGDNDAMILYNHGLLVTGRTVPETFLRLYRLEKACQVQLDAAAAGELRVMPDEIARKSGEELHGFQEPGAQPGQLEFGALKRRLDRVDSGYRH